MDRIADGNDEALAAKEREPRPIAWMDCEPVLWESPQQVKARLRMMPPSSSESGK